MSCTARRASPTTIPANWGAEAAFIDDDGQRRIGESVAASLAATGAEAVVTACPLCKKAIGRGTRGEVRDLAEIVAAGLR